MKLVRQKLVGRRHVDVVRLHGLRGKVVHVLRRCVPRYSITEERSAALFPVARQYRDIRLIRPAPISANRVRICIAFSPSPLMERMLSSRCSPTMTKPQTASTSGNSCCAKIPRSERGMAFAGDPARRVPASDPGRRAGSGAGRHAAPPGVATETGHPAWQWLGPWSPTRAWRWAHSRFHRAVGPQILCSPFALGRRGPSEIIPLARGFCPRCGARRRGQHPPSGTRWNLPISCSSVGSLSMHPRWPSGSTRGGLPRMGPWLLANRSSLEIASSIRSRSSSNSASCLGSCNRPPHPRRCQSAWAAEILLNRSISSFNQGFDIATALNSAPAT
jgi:hypothetical protein